MELEKLKEKLKWRYDNFKESMGEGAAYGYAAYKTTEELIDCLIERQSVVLVNGDQATPVEPLNEYLCSVCNKKCKSKLGLMSHSKTHAKLHTKK